MFLLSISIHGLAIVLVHVTLCIYICIECIWFCNVETRFYKWNVYIYSLSLSAEPPNAAIIERQRNVSKKLIFLLSYHILVLCTYNVNVICIYTHTHTYTHVCTLYRFDADWSLQFRVPAADVYICVPLHNCAASRPLLPVWKSWHLRLNYTEKLNELKVLQ